MPDSHSLLSSWMDRSISGEEIAQLSTRLARDRTLADELAEMAGMVQALADLAPHAPPARFVPRHSLTRILTGAAAALAAAGLAVLFWPGAPPRSAPREAAATSVSVVGSRPAPGALPRPPLSQEERARASLDRLLRRHSIARRTYSETTLRDIAAECLGRLQQKHDFQGSIDLSAAGSRSETPLTFSKSAGSLRGLLLHASALAGCSLAVNPDSLAFVPLPGSPTKSITKRFTGAAEAHESTRDFCATGTLPPAWGLPPSEFHAIPQPNGSLEVTATEWRLTQLEHIIEAMDAPVLTVDVMVFALPSAADGLEKLGLQHIAASLAQKREFPVLAVAAVLKESQWESMRPALVAYPDSLLTEFSVPVISGQWTDLGDRASDVLRWTTHSLGLRGVLGADELTFDLLIGCRLLGADATMEPAGTTSITVWTGLFLLLAYTDAAAPPESQNRGLMIRVQPLE